MKALEKRFAKAARVVGAASRRAAPRAAPQIEAARSGEPTLRAASQVYGAPSEGTATAGVYLHSRVDPRREGSRLAQAVPDGAGYLVVWGPGLFYEVEALLARETLPRLLVVEPEPDYLVAAFHARDLRGILGDSRCRFLVGSEATPREAAHEVTDSYLPVLHGGFRFELPRARASGASECARAVNGAAQRQIDDLSVQRRFGLRWFSNAVRNLTGLAGGSVELPELGRVAIAAAGPSLERELEALGTDVPVISTDTALPYLVSRGLTPAAAVSLDCQQVTYHHFLAARRSGARDRGGPNLAEIPLLADLSSSPTVLRQSRRAALFATGHPLAALLRRRFPDVTLAPQAGGNVTQAALSIAVVLGAHTVYILGADLAYPGGKPYARGTYLYPYFRSREDRLEPTSGRLLEMALSDPGLRAEESEEGRRYVTPKLATYRKELEASADSLDVEVHFGVQNRAERNDGTDHRTGDTPNPARRRGREARAGRRTLVVPPRAERRAFLRDYRAVLEELDPASAASADSASPEDTVRDHWYTLLPTAAAFLGPDLDVRKTAEVLAKAREWAIGRLDRYAAKPTPP
jgi:hypothetical protein